MEEYLKSHCNQLVEDLNAHAEGLIESLQQELEKGKAEIMALARGGEWVGRWGRMEWDGMWMGWTWGGDCVECARALSLSCARGVVLLVLLCDVKSSAHP